MTSKTKDNFNESNKKVYKYNVVKKPSVKIIPLDILNSIQMGADSLNGKIDEIYYIEQKLDAKRTIHRFKFTIIDDEPQEEVKEDE